MYIQSKALNIISFKRERYCKFNAFNEVFKFSKTKHNVKYIVHT